MERSPNCEASYYKSVSTLVSLNSSDSDTCNFNLSAFSCQDDDPEQPDNATREWMIGRANDALSSEGCGTLVHNFSTNRVGARMDEYPPQKLAQLGMASNCYAVANDPNQATHQILATCTPQYEMTEKATGRKVKNVHMKFTSDLASCDVSDSAMDQLLEDARKLAMFNAEESKGYIIDKPSDLACSYSVLPHI